MRGQALTTSSFASSIRQALRHLRPPSRGPRRTALWYATNVFLSLLLGALTQVIAAVLPDARESSGRRFAWRWHERGQRQYHVWQCAFNASSARLAVLTFHGGMSVRHASFSTGSTPQLQRLVLGAVERPCWQRTCCAPVRRAPGGHTLNISCNRRGHCYVVSGNTQRTCKTADRITASPAGFRPTKHARGLSRGGGAGDGIFSV